MPTPIPPECAAHLAPPEPNPERLRTHVATAAAAAASPRRCVEPRARVPLPIVDPPPLVTVLRSPPLAAAWSCVPTPAMEPHSAPPRLPPLGSEPRPPSLGVELPLRGRLPSAQSHPAAAPSLHHVEQRPHARCGAASPHRRIASPWSRRGHSGCLLDTVDPPPLAAPPCHHGAASPRQICAACGKRDLIPKGTHI
ncbi:hypothetical protein BS78_03G000900 [Paspalum vaginatum]|nr:hypothetical protein BS78_03G000900 [Paspalum vaginatum]